MKKSFIVLPCILALLFLAPLSSPAAKAASPAGVTVNKTSAYIGDPLLYDYHFNGFEEYDLIFKLYRNGQFFDYIPSVRTYSNYRGYFPPSVGTYYVVAEAWYVGIRLDDTSQSPETTVTLRPAPTAVSIEAISATALKISWNTVQGATGYEVWRSESKTGIYKLVKRTTSALFTNGYLTSGKQYFYKVRATNKIRPNYLDPSTVEVPSGSFSAPRAGIPLGKPTINSAKGISTSKVQLSWSSVSGANGYRVLRSASANGVFSLVISTPNTTFVVGGLSAGSSYYFKIQAYRRLYTTNYYGPLSGYRAAATLN